MIENKDVKIMGSARLDLIKIDAHHCFKCLAAFNGKKTQHHAIPDFMKPKRNVLIPICETCHKEINLYMIQQLPNFKSLNNFISNIESIVKKYKKKLDKYEKKEAED